MEPDVALPSLSEQIAALRARARRRTAEDASRSQPEPDECYGCVDWYNFDPPADDEPAREQRLDTEH
jgi:hypothetical protein